MKSTLNWIERTTAMQALNMNKDTFLKFVKGLTFSQEDGSRKVYYKISEINERIESHVVMRQVA